MITTPKAYLSGICIIVNEGEEVKGSIFNEFGISALDFIYYPKTEKIKFLHVIEMMNKWYIKKVLKKDLVNVIHGLKQGKTHYNDIRFKLDYKFVPMQGINEESVEYPNDFKE